MRVPKYKLDAFEVLRGIEMAINQARHSRQTVQREVVRLCHERYADAHFGVESNRPTDLYEADSFKSLANLIERQCLGVGVTTHHQIEQRFSIEEGIRSP